MFLFVSASVVAVSDEEEGLRDLGRRVVARRLELDFNSGRDFAEAVGVSSRVITDIERGNRPVGAKTKARLERALKWEVGTVDAILSGAPMPHEALSASQMDPVLSEADQALVSEYDAAYRELVSIEAKARGLEAQLAALAPHVDEITERILMELPETPAGEAARRNARGIGEAFLKLAENDPSRRWYEIVSPLQRYVGAKAALRHLQLFRQGGEADGDAAPTTKPGSGPDVTPDRPTVRSLPTVGQIRPNLSAFEDEVADAARDEDRESPRLGDE